MNETENLYAVHEAGRVVFTYLNGYYCDSIETASGGSGKMLSKLNAGQDVPVVQAVLSGNPLSSTNIDINRSVEIAKKLMTIYCAGTCAELFFQNNETVPADLEMEITGQDMKYIENIQKYLMKSVVDHPDDFPSQTIIAIFKKLEDEDIRKAIRNLSKRIIESDSGTVSAFTIEDTLMPCGIKRQKVEARSGFSVGVEEDRTVKPTVNYANSSKLPEITPLDLMLTDFLKKIKSDWKPGELEGATYDLKNIYNKFGE
jgi:hypothetical protein